MATKDTTFTVAGVVRKKGELKIKFANSVDRIKALEKDGCEDIRMFDLERPLLKHECVYELSKIDELQDAETMMVLATFLEKAGHPLAASSVAFNITVEDDQSEIDPELQAEIDHSAELEVA